MHPAIKANLDIRVETKQTTTLTLSKDDILAVLFDAAGISPVPSNVDVELLIDRREEFAGLCITHIGTPHVKTITNSENGDSDQ